MSRNKVNSNFVEMLKSGVIMDVMNAEQARIAEEAGACAVMALERVPAIIRKEGGIARASDPQMIKEIQNSVKIPVMAKVRIGHTAEARVLEALEVDCIDESEVLTPADRHYHIDKWQFKVPFVCGCTDLFEAIRRIDEGAVLIRCKGQAGTGDISEAVRHLRLVYKQLSALQHKTKDELKFIAQENRVSFKNLKKAVDNQKLPAPLFAAGGIATPADASLCMHLGAESVFVGSGVFLSENPFKMARAIVEVVNNPEDFNLLAKVSEALGGTM